MSEAVSVRQPRLLLKELSQDGVHLKESARLHPLNQPTELNARIMSTATLTLPESDPELALHDLVELYTVKGSAGIFWVVGEEPNYGKNRVYKLNHAVDILSASTCHVEETYDSTTSGFISKLLSDQSQRIGNSPYWRLGTCEDTAIWHKEIKYDNVLSDLSELEKDHEDYHFVFDFSTFPWTLSFVRFSDDVVSEFRLSRNIEKEHISLNDSNLCTRLFLSITTKATVTENDQNAGEIETTEYRSFENAAGIAQWGIIDRAAGIETDKVPDVEAYVQDYFRKHSTAELSIDIDGLEVFRLSGEHIDEANLGGICRVTHPKYAAFFNERILSVRYPDAIKSPIKVSIAMANKRKDLAGSIASVRKTADKAASIASSALRAAKNNSTKLKQLAYQFEDETGNLKSMIEMNAEHLRTQFENTKDQLTSKFEQTAEHFRWELEDGKRQLSSQMELTAYHLQTDFNDKLNGLHSEFEVTATHLRTDFTDELNQLSSHFEITAEHLQTSFEDRLFGFKSEVELNAQHLQATFTDRLRQMESTFELSAQHMQASFTDRINGLESTFELNAAHLRTEFYNQVEGLQAEFEVNARNLNYATTKADENGNILAKAGLYIGTDGNIAYNYNAVNGVGTQFQQHADAIGTVVGTYNGRYFIKAGEVVDSINAQTGQTIHKVDMDMITLRSGAIIKAINGGGNNASEVTIDFNKLNLTSGTVIKLLNGGQSGDSTLKIEADKLDLTGCATVGSLNTEKGRIDNLISGTTQATKLWAATMLTGDLEVGTSNSGTFKYKGNTISTLNALSPDGTKIQAVLGIMRSPDVSSGLSALKGAFNSCSASSNNGVITLTFGKLGTNESSATVNFNMADTQYFRDAVSAARPTGIQSSLTLGSGDIGTSSKYITVFCADDEEYDFPINIDASAVYRAGRASVTPIVYFNGYEKQDDDEWETVAMDNHTIYLEPGEYSNVYVQYYNHSTSSWVTKMGKYEATVGEGTCTFAYRYSNIGTQFQVHINGVSSGLYGVLEYDDGYVYMRDADTGYDYARVYVANLV